MSADPMNGDLSWLADLCDASRAPLARPGVVVVSESPYLCASNGHAMLLIAGATEAEPHPYESQIGGMVATLPRATTSFALADLRAFLGPYADAAPPVCVACNGTRVATCDECDGKGEVDCSCTCGDDHMADCEDCDGKGTVHCDCQGVKAAAVDPFVMGGTAFQRPLVAQYIRHLPDCEVQAAIRPVVNFTAGPSVFHGNGWMLMLMPLSERHNDAPVFPLAMECAA